MKRFIRLAGLILVLSFNSRLNGQQADIQINPNFTWNGENNLVINPQDSQNLVVAWMKLTTLTQVTIAVSRSIDGGLTWSDPLYMPHFNNAFTSADPTLTFRDDGKVFLAYIDYNKNIWNAGAVYICNSVDGGLTWSQPVETININATPDKGIDRPWITADQSGGAYHHRIYMVTKGANLAPFPHHIYLVTSADTGITWSTPKQIDTGIQVGPQSNSMGVPAVTLDGKLCIAYLSYDPAASFYVRNILAKSTDGGNSFTWQPIDTLAMASIIPPEDSLYQYSEYLGANPVNAGNMTFIYTDRRFGDWDILSTSTHDGGQTWSPVQRINSDPLGNGITQDMCWGSYTPSGKFVALWRDRRDGSSAPASPYRIYGTVTLSDGVNYSPDFALSQTAGGLSIPVDGNDFLGVAATDSTLFSSWADKRGITNQVFFNKHLIPNIVSIKEPGAGAQSLINNSLVTTNCITVLNSNPKTKIIDFTILNSIGRVVKTDQNCEMICFDQLPDGLYFLLIKVEQQVTCQKIILDRSH
ncbi:MAG: hypothetical protein WCL00_02850 [Bacteroidota bacterium]